MIIQRLESIQQEMAKGEDADYSRFRPANMNAKQPAQESHVQAAKEAEPVEEEVQHHGRSR